MNQLVKSREQQIRAPFVEPRAKQRSIFTVKTADEFLGLPVECVHTIFRIERITAIPLAPAVVIGLVNLRGKVVTAVSLRRRIGRKDLNSHEGAIAIGIEHLGESFALLVDEVGDVVNVLESARIPPPPNLTAFRLSLTTAVYRMNQGFISVLELDAVLNFNQTPLKHCS